jgi:branched-chain amino acid transport system substrate-binding protein
MFRSRPFTRTVVALAGASLFLTACGGDDNGGGSGGGGGGGDTTGVTDTSIKIGTHMPLTGPAAPGYSEIPTGAKASFDYVNAQGGINGREVEYIVRDDAYNPSNTTTVVNQLVLQDEVFAILGGLGTPTHSAVLDFLNEEEVPDLFVSSGATAWDEPDRYPWTFGYQPDYVVEGKIIGQFIQENFPDAKVGLYLQGDELGRDGAEGVKAIIEDQIVAEVTYVVTDTSVRPQMQQLQSAGADLVVGFNVPGFTARQRGAASELGYTPTYFTSNVGADANLVGTLIAGASQGAVTPEQAAAVLDGTYTTLYLPTADQPDDPWVQFFQEVWDEHGDGGDLTNYRIYGMMQAYLFTSAALAAGEDLTREGIVEAIQSDGSSWKGPWLAPLGFSEDSHRGVTGAKIVKLEGGAAIDQTPVYTTTEEADAEIEEVTEEPGEPTEDGLPDVG